MMLITTEENSVWEEKCSQNSQKPNCFKSSSQLLEFHEVKNGKSLWFTEHRPNVQVFL